MKVLEAWQFEFYSSFPFWAALLAVAVVVRLAGARPRVRSALLLAASSALLLAIPRFGPRDLALVWGVGLLSFAAAALLAPAGRVVAPGKRRALAVAGVLAVLGVLAFFKYRFLQGLLRAPSGSAPPKASD